METADCLDLLQSFKLQHCAYNYLVYRIHILFVIIHNLAK